MANYKNTYFFEICKNPCTKWDKYWVCDDASGNIPPEREASWIKHCPQWWLKSSLACKFTWSYKTPQLRWSLNVMKSQETCKICLLQQGFPMSRFFYIYFTITGVKKLFIKPRISSNRGLLEVCLWYKTNFCEARQVTDKIGSISATFSVFGGGTREHFLNSGW